MQAVEVDWFLLSGPQPLQLFPSVEAFRGMMPLLERFLGLFRCRVQYGGSIIVGPTAAQRFNLRPAMAVLHLTTGSFMHRYKNKTSVRACECLP